MRILHIITSLKIGGAERALCNLLATLKTEGWSHHVAYFHDGPCRQDIHALGIPTYHITGTIHRYDPTAYHQLKQLASDISPHVIHSSLWVANIMGRLLSKQINVPVLCDLHGNCEQEGRVRNFFDRHTAHLTFTTIAVSDTVQQAYQSHIIKNISSPNKRVQAQQRLMIIKNGIDARGLRKKAVQQPLSRAEMGIPDNAFVVGSVGRFEPIKSYEYLLKAFALLNKKSLPQPIVLCLVGSGSQEEYLKKLAHTLDISHNTIFTGARTDTYRIYPNFNCFALSSQSEGLSLAILEAMCFGLPVVTTHEHQSHDVITRGRNGFMVKPQDFTALANAIETLIRSPETVKQMIIENSKLVDEHFDIQSVAQQYKNIFQAAVQYNNL
jgi:glycosyltransferase involved in cell wall biosynthesis